MPVRLVVVMTTSKTANAGDVKGGVGILRFGLGGRAVPSGKNRRYL